MSINGIIFPRPKSTYTDSKINKLDSNSVVHFIPSVSIIDKEDIHVPVLFMTYSMYEFTFDNYLLYFHGNAEDLGSSLKLLKHMRDTLRTNIIAVEYPGYGIYPGNPTSDQIKIDALSIYDYLNKTMDIPENRITVVGRSIGSGPACEVGSKRHPKSVVLVSAFTSIKKLSGDLSFGLASYFVKERFNNIQSLENFTSPVLLIHGMADSLIKYQHSKLLEARLNELGKSVIAEYPEQMTHNKFRFEIDLISPVKRFLNHITPQQTIKIPLEQLPPVFLSFKALLEKKEYEDNEQELENHKEKEQISLQKNEDPFLKEQSQQQEQASPKRHKHIQRQRDLAQENHKKEFEDEGGQTQEIESTDDISWEGSTHENSLQSPNKNDYKMSEIERSQQIEKYLKYQKMKQCEPCCIRPVREEEQKHLEKKNNEDFSINSKESKENSFLSVNKCNNKDLQQVS